MDGEPLKHGTYLAYMLRLWQAGSRQGRPVWHASLENPHTGERLAFGDPQKLFAFLAELMTSLDEPKGASSRLSLLESIARLNLVTIPAGRDGNTATANVAQIA